MRSNRRGYARRRGGSDGNYWISFSDLMSSIVVIIILVMFYIIYQYFNMAEVNAAEIARRQYDLDQAQTELQTQQEKLTAAEKEMIAQQILLDAKQAELDDAQSILESQRTRLEEAETALSDKETEIAAQQEALDALDAKLEDQQAQIEELVGLKTRIISSLSTALRENEISATVDSATGAIALESDVLFESGEYKLSERGKDFVDQFLPIYLDVLFSEGYSEYVSEIIIEGHTDPAGGYIDNLELSQQRALAVATYVLRDGNTKITYAQKQALRDIVTVNGRSFSDPIYYEGTSSVDYEASRRVVFKFRLTDEKMISQLRDILEESDAAMSEAAENTGAEEAAEQ